MRAYIQNNLNVTEYGGFIRGSHEGNVYMGSE